MQMGLLVGVVTAGAYSGSAMSPLQETMRAALALTDNQVAVLQGPALALPMVLAAIPLGLLIDRHSRVRLLVVLAALNVIGSVFTALASSFMALLAARCLIGLAAFAVNPVASSLVADWHPPQRRGRATMYLVFGQSAGMGAVFGIGGLLLARPLGPAVSWRWVLLALTAPLILAIPAALRMTEPQRSGTDVSSPSTSHTWRELWHYRFVAGPLLIGVVMTQIGLGADYIWAAPMLSRDFHLATGELGAILAGGLLLSGVSGSALGGVLADACQQRGGPVRTLAGLIILSTLAVPTALYAFAPGAPAASVLLTVFITIMTAASVMGTTLLIIVIPNELRGLCTAVMMAACVVIGSGLAPLMVSALATSVGGGSMIGKSLSTVCALAGMLAAASFALSRRSMGGLGEEAQVPGLDARRLS
jgi:MFS family permease